MGLIDRILKGGKDGKDSRAGEPTSPHASTQFFESDPASADSQDERALRRRELVQVVLRDTMRNHGIPSDWIECRILSAVTRGGRRGLHVNFVVRQAHEQLLPYVFPFQDSFERELARFDPRCRDWLMSLGWEFTGFKPTDTPEARNRAPAARGDTPPAVPASAPVPAVEEPPKEDDGVEQDLAALFAIRDAALADTTAAAPAPSAHPDQPDFEPTHPSPDAELPRT